MQGVVRLDTNWDGLPENDEPGVKNIPVVLYGIGTYETVDVVTSTFTGEYFMSAHPGSYYLFPAPDPESGYEAGPFRQRVDLDSCPGTIHDRDLIVRPCYAWMGVTVTYQETITITRGLAGVVVRIYKNSVLYREAVTGETGGVSFLLLSGDYDLQIISPAGWIIPGDLNLGLHLGCNDKRYYYQAYRPATPTPKP